MSKVNLNELVNDFKEDFDITGNEVILFDKALKDLSLVSAKVAKDLMDKGIKKDRVNVLVMACFNILSELAETDSLEINQ